VDEWKRNPASKEEWGNCAECQGWAHAVDASFEKLCESAGLTITGKEAQAILFMDSARKADALVKPWPFDLFEWFARTKAAMLPIADVLKKAIESGELPLPPGEHRQSHKSQEEFLACDVCQGWEKRRDAIVEKALGRQALGPRGKDFRAQGPSPGR
jgi:hypothetical protein